MCFRLFLHSLFCISKIFISLVAQVPRKFFINLKWVFSLAYFFYWKFHWSLSHSKVKCFTLTRVHIFPLFCRCDLATLGQISDAEDIIEELTGGAKIVRSQFCKVPLDLVLDFGKIEAQPEVKEDVSVPAILSHEALPKMTFQVANIGNTYVGVSSYDQADDQSAVASKKRVSNEMQRGRILIFFIYSCILKFIRLLNLGLFTILWYSLFAVHTSL